MRDLQIHFSSEEDPYSFTEYALFLKIIYRNVKNNLAKLNGISLADDGKEERKIEEEEWLLIWNEQKNDQPNQMRRNKTEK